jgi:hypothetical protein
MGRRARPTSKRATTDTTTTNNKMSRARIFCYRLAIDIVGAQERGAPSTFLDMRVSSRRSLFPVASPPDNFFWVPGLVLLYHYCCTVLYRNVQLVQDGSGRSAMPIYRIQYANVMPVMPPTRAASFFFSFNGSLVRCSLVG